MSAVEVCLKSSDFMNSPSKVAAKKVLVISVLISLFSPMSILAAEDIAKSGKDNINYAFSGASNSLKKLKRRTGKTVSKLVEDVSTTIADANEGLVESIARESRKESETNIEIRQEQLPPSQPQPSASVDFDFDGDGKADFAKWNQGAAEYKIRNSNGGTLTTTTIGASSSKMSPGDFDGDGKVDAAAYNGGSWNIKKSSDGTTISMTLGSTGDIPMVADYDGDGISDIAVYRPSTNIWYVKESITGNTATQTWGQAGDIPVTGDFDGDGKADKAIWRPATGVWHVIGTALGIYSKNWGVAADIPAVADFDGDGISDFSLYRGSTGTWYVLKSSTGFVNWDTQVWGSYGDQPVPADYDGDNKADYAVWRPSTSVWYVIKSSDSTYQYHTLGTTGDLAVSSAYIKQIGGSILSYDLAKARLSPKNATGGTDLYSRNFGWSTSLVGLPGRSGLDAGFGMSYNSLVWTKDTVNNSIVFDADHANITPGFRFGFPTIEPVYYVPGASDGVTTEDPYFAYVMVTPSGSRIEFKQIGASAVFETQDSSYVQLKTKTAPDPNDPVEDIVITVTTTDGVSMTYEWKAGAFRCQQIKDRNGNFITIEHDEQGSLRTLTDTLGRVVTVNYNAQLYPTSIMQTWKNNNGSGSNVNHTWASFSYADLQIQTNFGSLNVVGPANGTTIKVLSRVTYPDGSHTDFDYNTWGQVRQINNFAADDHKLNHVRVNLPADATTLQTDCPRFTETKTYVENFNSGNETTITNALTTGQTYSLPGSISGTATKIEVSMTGDPHGSVSKTYVGESGWMEGLPIATEDWADGSGSPERKRWTWASWTQDDPAKAYKINPRIIESRVGDNVSVKKSTVEYYLEPSTTIAKFGLIKEAKIYDADLTTVLKRSYSEYNLDAAYLSRRIIGLPSLTESYGTENGVLTLAAKTTYSFDEGDFTDPSLGQDISPAQHDGTYYGAAFVVGRGNLTSVTKYDVTGQNAPITASTKYNTAGSPVAQITPWDGVNTRTVKIGYADNFNSTVANATFAYPTVLTDPAGNSSTVKYRYDTGANVRAQSPAPAGNSQGKITERIYDNIGRLSIDRIVNYGGPYVRYEYPANGVQAKKYTTIVDEDEDGADSSDEVLAESWSDGAGRVLRSRTEHPGSTGGWSATLAVYDVLGRPSKQSVPTEVDSNWNPAGDDAVRGFLWTHQKYDWKGRVVRKINTDGVDSPALNDSDVLISYEGCGCAGGQITTIEGELVPRDDNPLLSARRSQRIYSDILGRDYKTEELNWTGGVYRTLIKTYNGRDQILRDRLHEGYWTNPRYQTTSQTYDGFGRLASKHVPQQDNGSSTLYSYYPDGRLHTVTDARGATKTYTYEARGLVTGILDEMPVGSVDSIVPPGPCDVNDPDCGNPSPFPSPLPTPINTPTPVPTPSPVPTPTGTMAVSYQYDNAGNRTQMDDDRGSVVYEYNELSQLTAEVRAFDDTLPNAPLSSNRFKLTYEYSLSGQLSAVKDPYGIETVYSFDRVGRLTSVDGTVFHGVTSYANSAEYRAWGALKELTYGNQTDMSITFNERLSPDHYRLKKTSGGIDIIKRNYDYNADGRLRYIQDEMDNKFDRLNIYDHTGRIKQGKTGLEARGGTVTGYEDQKQNLPYRQSFEWNVYDNMTERNNLHWGKASWFGHSNNLSYAYYNNRIVNQGWSHDKDGRVLAASEPNSYSTSEYDARGNLRSIATTDGQTNTSSEVFRHYDGDGREVKREARRYEELPHPPPYGQWVDEDPKYYIRSSMLGGAVLTEADKTGRRVKGYVYAARTRLATQIGQAGGTNGQVLFEFSDASGTARRAMDAAGTLQMAEGFDGAPAELDPLGGNVGLSTPYWEVVQPNPPVPEIPDLEQWGPMNDAPLKINGQQVSCQLDGMTIGCGIAMSMLDNGSAIPAAFAGFQGMEGFGFESNGLGIYTVTLPDIFTNNSGNIWGQPHGTRGEGWRIFEGGSFIFSTSWGIQTQTDRYDKTPFSQLDLERMWQSIDNTVQGNCAEFIEKLAKVVTGKDVDARLFLAEGFNRAATTWGINWGGIYGYDGFGAGATFRYSADRDKAEIQFGRQGKPFSDTSFRIGPISAIHEVMHVAARADDITLSRAVRQLGITVIADDGKTEVEYPTDEDNRNLKYSGYWGQALKNHCSETASHVPTRKRK